MTNGQQKFRGAFITVTSLFFMWGFITVMVDALIPRLKDVFELTYLQAGLVQFAWFTAYGVISIPGGRLIKRIGYKNGILVGLCLAAFGCLLFYPAAETSMFVLFLLALFVVAAGITVLQVAANPYISVLGSKEGASSRLNLAQAFNSLGTTIAPIISATYLLSDEVKTAAEQTALTPSKLEEYRVEEALAVQMPFVIVAVSFLLLASIIAMISLPRVLEGAGQAVKRIFGFKREDEENEVSVVFFADRRLLAGALGIFVYVGAEVTLGSYMVNYGMDLGLHRLIEGYGSNEWVFNETQGHWFRQTSEVISPTSEVTSSFLSRMASIASNMKGVDLAEMAAKAQLGVLLTFYWGGAMVGRFIGAGLMRHIRPSILLSIFATVAGLLVATSIMSSGLTALFALLAVGLFNSIMFPTIFTLGIENLGDAKPQGSGILCTAIVGGAFIPPAFGALLDVSGFGLALMLPILCYGYIAAFGYFTSRV